MFNIIFLQYWNILFIVFSSYKYKVAPFNKVIKNSKILTSKEILVDAKQLSRASTPPNNFVKLLTKLLRFWLVMRTPFGVPVEPDV